jgi:hypothetical protein
MQDTTCSVQGREIFIGTLKIFYRHVTVIVFDDPLVAEMNWEARIDVKRSIGRLQLTVVKNQSFRSLHWRVKMGWKKEIEIMKIAQARCKTRGAISNIGAIRRELDVEIIGCQVQFTFDNCENMRG